MPIYEYESISSNKACSYCKSPFEVFQGVEEMPIKICPKCGGRLKKIISCCHSAVMETSGESVRVEKRVSDYEKSGMWSHAAELADKHSEKTKDKTLRMRALDNYKKAGYDVDSLVKHAKINND